MHRAMRRRRSRRVRAPKWSISIDARLQPHATPAHAPRKRESCKRAAQQPDGHRLRRLGQLDFEGQLAAFRVLVREIADLYRFRVEFNWAEWEAFTYFDAADYWGWQFLRVRLRKAKGPPKGPDDALAADLSF